MQHPDEGEEEFEADVYDNSLEDGDSEIDGRNDNGEETDESEDAKEGFENAGNDTKSENNFDVDNFDADAITDLNNTAIVIENNTNSDAEANEEPQPEDFETEDAESSDDGEVDSEDQEPNSNDTQENVDDEDNLNFEESIIENADEIDEDEVTKNDEESEIENTDESAGDDINTNEEELESNNGEESDDKEANPNDLELSPGSDLLNAEKPETKSNATIIDDNPMRNGTDEVFEGISALDSNENSTTVVTTETTAAPTTVENPVNQQILEALLQNATAPLIAPAKVRGSKKSRRKKNLSGDKNARQRMLRLRSKSLVNVEAL